MSATAIFSAIVAVVKAIPIIDKWWSQFLSWYMTSQTNETLTKISDAAAFALNCKTDEDRYAASKKWQEALSRPRYTP